jgi:Protein of unknown function (DUF1569)
VKTVADPGQRASLLVRAACLRPESSRRWGHFSCPQMLAHVNDSFRYALGELHIAPLRHLARYPPIKQMLLYVVPFPKNAPTAPETIARRPGSWEDEQRAFGRLLERLAEVRWDGDWPDHFIFGRMSGRDWSVLLYKHADHHFRQFGA